MALSVPELAKCLSVNESRARLLVRSGRIPAQRVGGRWIIDEADAANYPVGVPAGRPLSERSAWQLLLYSCKQPVPNANDLVLSPVERHRVNLRWERILESQDPLMLVRSLLARRAERAEFSSSPEDLAELRRDPRLRLSGVSHPDSGLLSNSELEGYVSRKNFGALVKDWFLVKAAAGQRPNVVLHVADEVPDELPLLLVAADLAERPGVREHNAALDLIRRVHAD